MTAYGSYSCSSAVADAARAVRADAISRRSSCFTCSFAAADAAADARIRPTMDSVANKQPIAEPLNQAKRRGGITSRRHFSTTYSSTYPSLPHYIRDEKYYLVSAKKQKHRMTRTDKKTAQVRTSLVCNCEVLNAVNEVNVRLYTLAK